MTPSDPAGGESPKTRRTLDPKRDVVFKLFFTRNPDLLISLLTAVLRPPVPIASVEFPDRSLPKTVVVDKGGFLDVLVELDDGKRVDVEMQCRQQSGLRQRALVYWARLYGTQGRRGQQHQSWPPCVSIFILAFRELPGARFHRIFKVRDVEDGEVFSDALELHTVELPKLPSQGVESGDVALERWGRFLAVGTDEELEELAMSDPVMRKAKEALDELSADPAAQELARQRELTRWSYEFEMAESRREGREEGRQEGRQEGREEGRAQGAAVALRGAIQALCEVLDVELHQARREALARTELADLERLHEVLRTRRRWPDD